MVQRVSIVPKTLTDAKAEYLLHEITHTLKITSVTQVIPVKIYLLEGLTEGEAEEFAKKALCDHICQIYYINQKAILNGIRVEVAYKQGVTNPETASILKAAHDLSFTGLAAADSRWEYYFFGSVSKSEISTITSRLLFNPTIEEVVAKQPKTLMLESSTGESIEVIPIRSMSPNQLADLSQRRSLFLNTEEMEAIQNYFRGAGRDLTDAELEAIAQWWSEHCLHKTFKSPLVINGQPKDPLIKRLMAAAERVGEGLIVSAFVDNAGVIDFYDGYAIAAKVETHNSPSALEPFGGAATGVGGVIRDILGTGKGAQVLATSDVFCFAPLETSEQEIPKGALSPRYLLRHVVRGVGTYGNNMGIPTCNGSLHFHRDFRAKPSVIVGSYGIIPTSHAQKGIPRTGDKIILIGGKTGRDGIHGATFSSGAMTGESHEKHTSAVQIGNPIQEKRLADLIILLRDRNLIRAITDCGAGGLSCAVGEISSNTGSEIDLSLVPLKYEGLSPWEIFLSESQERMVMAVDPKHQDELLEACKLYGVEASVLGQFTDNKTLKAMFEEEVVCNLPLDFLAHGWPKTPKVGNSKPEEAKTRIPTAPRSEKGWIELYNQVLSHGNVCSKEPIVRMYDHGVQGTNALPPFSGVRQDAPNDAAVLTPVLGKPFGLVISHGLNPILMKLDPYWGALWAAVEALSNLAAVGGNVSQAALIDNFVWPVPTEENLPALDAALEACITVMKVFGTPFVSGKDSLSGTYVSQDGEAIEIPPYLCVSAFGKIPDVSKTVTSDFKKAGSCVILLGRPDYTGMGGSIYYQLKNKQGGRVPRPDIIRLPFLYQRLYSLIRQGKVLSAHDISEGGLLSALAEMCFGSSLGANINLSSLGEERVDNLLFNETSGCFVVEVEKETYENGAFAGLPYRLIGATTTQEKIAVHNGADLLFSSDVELLRNAWQNPMKEVFHG